MFHGLLKSRFFSKCKSDLKVIRTRIEIIKRKKNAVQKYLKNDVVDLLNNGFDINAFTRAEGLIMEMEKSNCYDFINQYCETVLNRLADIDKQKGCPEECREAVSSLMFAAARFADLPELRQLRKLFFDRYGSSLNCYVGKQFVEKVTSGVPSKNAKLQLLQEIAEESGLEWSSKTLENQLFNESTRTNGYDYIGKFQDKIESDYDTDVSPVKDIPVNTIKGVMVDHDHGDHKPLKYGSIAPPYTKPKANTKNQDKENETWKEIEVGPGGRWNQPREKVKSVRTRGCKPQLDQSSSEGSDIDGKDKTGRALKFFDKNEFDEEKLGNNNKDSTNRTTSLPSESVSSPPEDQARHVRSASCQMNVHPRLPDYDELVARLASMKRESRH